MDKNFGNCARGYSIHSHAWYHEALQLGPNVVDDMIVGLYNPDGSTPGEFVIEWVNLAGKVVPRIKAFDDSWAVLHHFVDVLEKLAALNGTDPSVETIGSVLNGCGFIDLTVRNKPL